MNSIRGISRKIDAMLLMIIAGLLLALALAWNYYQARRMTIVEKETLAASLLAYRLPSEAAGILEETIRRQPMADRSLKLRKALADIYMNEMNDYEKALAELVFIKTYAPASSVASGTESLIQLCLNRLGRVYDAERARMLAAGENPLVADASEASVVRFGNRHAISVDDLKARIATMDVPNGEVTEEKIDAILDGMVQELLLSRAAEREKITNTPEFVDRVRRFEKSLAINTYLQNHLFRDHQSIDEARQRELLAAEINRLAKNEAMQIDRDLIRKTFFTAASATKTIAPAQQ